MSPTRLAPIEKPPSLLFQLAYWFTKRQFGKVLTPLKVVYARLPFACSLWSNKIQSLDKRLSLPADLKIMIAMKTAQLNTCNFCIDIGKAIAIQQFGEQDKFFQLDDYAHSSLYSAREKAALAFAEELTASRQVSDATFEQARRLFSERELVEIAWVVTTEHVYNLMNIAFHIESDGLCQVKKAPQATLELHNA